MSKNVSSQDSGAIAEEIKLAFQSFNYIPQKVQLNIPRHLVTVRFLKIPSTDDQEINKIIKIESIKHLPYTDEEAIYGYKIIERLEDGYSRVLLVIAQAGIINNFINILNNAAVSGIKSLSLSSEALFLWYMLAKEGREDETVMVVNLDSDHIDMDVIEKDKLVFTRGITYSAGDPQKMHKIASETGISISTYQKESSKPVDRIILTGANGEIENSRAFLARELKLPVEIIDQTKNMPIDEDVKAAEGNVSFAGLLGLCLKSGDAEISLLPESAREETRLILSKNNLITAIVLSILLITVSFGIFIKKLHDKNVYSSIINAELKKMEPKVAATKKMMKDIGIIRETMAKKPLAVDIVAEIYGITPGGISLNMLDFESGKSITIRGSAQALNDVFKYVTILENSPYFEGVKVKYANKRMVENREMADFEIDAFLTKLK